MVFLSFDNKGSAADFCHQCHNHRVPLADYHLHMGFCSDSCLRRAPGTLRWGYCAHCGRMVSIRIESWLIGGYLPVHCSNQCRRNAKKERISLGDMVTRLRKLFSVKEEEQEQAFSNTI
jgi:hypothetical protein